jgi:hypothetical protein
MPRGVCVIAVALHLCAITAMWWVVRVLVADGSSFDEETRLYVACTLALIAVAYEVVAFGVHGRKGWAWTASLVFLPIGMASLVSLGPSLVAMLFFI